MELTLKMQEDRPERDDRRKDGAYERDYEQWFGQGGSSSAWKGIQDRVEDGERHPSGTTVGKGTVYGYRYRAKEEEDVVRDTSLLAATSA